MDNLSEKHGFIFTPTSYETEGVRRYVLQHYMDNGYPLDTPSDAQNWVAVSKDEKVYCVFGWRNLPKAIEVTDFYTHPSRYGKLAGYAAIQKIKRDADLLQIPILTATPSKNSPMMEAYKRVFEVQEPILYVYKYEPKPPQPAIELKESA